MTTNTWHYDKVNLTVECITKVGICDEKGVKLVLFLILNLVFFTAKDAKLAEKFI